MAYVFLDTNAFIKLYLNEKGSEWLRTFVLDKNSVLSELTFAETATTLGRLYRQGAYTRMEAVVRYNQIYQERFKFEIIRLETKQIYRVASLAFNLPANSRLRALDAIQLTAANARADSQNPPVPLTFVSSDLQLLNVAQTIGFSVENPENHL